MRDYFDDRPEFDPDDIKTLSGEDKTNFINYVYQDYNHYLKVKGHPELLMYYKDVLTRLIKTFGH